MDYKNYLDYRKGILGDGDVLDAGDLDLYGKFPRAAIQDEEVPEAVYRCHLVEDFLRVNNLSIGKSMVAFSQGVRHSLSLLMEAYKDKTWLIPSDNYPFYSQASKDAGLKADFYESLHAGSFGDLRDSSPEGDILLATYPFKPSGRGYSVFDWAFLQGWLSADAKRHLILDAVYVFRLEEEKELLTLFAESTQVTILYSLSKAYASPQTAGFTFTKDKDIREVFKGLSKDEEALRLCYSLLNTDYGRKRHESVRSFIRGQWQKALLLGLVPAGSSQDSYLFYAGESQHRFLTEGYLSVPASVFGSHRNTSVVSTLGLP